VSELRQAWMAVTVALAGLLAASSLAGCEVSLQGTCVTCDAEGQDATSLDGTFGGEAAVADATNEGNLLADAGVDVSSAVEEQYGNDASTSCSEDGTCAATCDEGGCGAASCLDSEGGCASADGSIEGGDSAGACNTATDCAQGQACNTTTFTCQSTCEGALCNGCCDGANNCQAGTDPNNCGDDGGTCASCTPGRTCMQGSYCSCAAAGDCPPGLACVPGTGVCQAACNDALCNGCCDQGFNLGTCHAGTSVTECNTGGHTCQTCTCPSPACVPLASRYVGGAGGNCGCATNADCSSSCGGEHQYACENDFCR